MLNDFVIFKSTFVPTSSPKIVVMNAVAFSTEVAIDNSVVAGLGKILNEEVNASSIPFGQSVHKAQQATSNVSLLLWWYKSM